MFDYINYECECPCCHSAVTDFQSRSGNCNMSRLTPNSVEEFYGMCSCGAWLEFSRVSPGVYRRSLKERFGAGGYLNNEEVPIPFQTATELAGKTLVDPETSLHYFVTRDILASDGKQSVTAYILEEAKNKYLQLSDHPMSIPGWCPLMDVESQGSIEVMLNTAQLLDHLLEAAGANRPCLRDDLADLINDLQKPIPTENKETT